MARGKGVGPGQGSGDRSIPGSFKRKPSGLLGAFLILAWIVIAIFVPLLAPYGATQTIMGILMTTADGEVVVLRELAILEDPAPLIADYEAQHPEARAI